MTKINVKLTFNGNCEEAFHFYKSVFGGEFSFLGRFKDMPSIEGQPAPESEAEKIMHISLPISAETTLAGCDNFIFIDQERTIGNNFSISINTDTEAEANRLYNGLSEGGQATMPMTKTFWSPYFGMLTDKFGIQWLVNS